MQRSRRQESDREIVELFRRHEINPASQRVMIVRLLFARAMHMSAEDIFRLVNAENRRVSKATVYNTLGLFAERGLIREVVADPTRIFYDPNTAPHHPFYNTSTGKLMDIPVEDVQIRSLPTLPDGMRMEGVDVIVRMCPNVQDKR